MAKVPADCVWGADNVSVSALPAGFSVYAAYWNGPFENYKQAQARFPKAHILTVATRLPGSKGARAADAEIGTLALNQAGNLEDVAAFLNEYEGGELPLVYTMASWASTMEHYLAMNGHPRSSYYLWVAHYSSQHLCGPKSIGGCGYGASMADATQYATGVNDYNVFRGYVISGSVAPTVAGGVTLGATGDQVKLIQQQLNTWAKWCGFAPLIVDGDCGGKTFAATILFQQKRGVGLAVDGVIGPDTEKYLKNPPGTVRKIVSVTRSVPKPTLPPGTPVLMPGSQGKQVAALQYYLRNSGIRGVRGIEADGDYGDQTEAAVRNLQGWAKFKPAAIDGKYGKQTAKALTRVAVG